MNHTASLRNPLAQQLAKKAAIALLISRILYAGLLVFFSLWYLLISPPPSANPWVIWFIHALPLLCFLPGMIKASPRSFAWLCFVLQIYVCEAAIYSLSPAQAMMGVVEGLLTLALFSSAIIFIRCNGKSRKAEEEAVV